ncbi:MAG: 30S ribosomal protein S9 [Candidatus Dojkabacteria bacterium]
MEKKYFEGIGRRKRSTSRVRIYEGDKASSINGKAINIYFSGDKDSEKVVNRPLIVVGLENKYFFTATVNGGGITGQLEAVRLGLARALYTMNSELKPVLRKEKLVSRDPREVERKKYNHVKARKKPQFSKR